jgi:hypothetical protein
MLPKQQMHPIGQLEFSIFARFRLNIKQKLLFSSPLMFQSYLNISKV